LPADAASLAAIPGFGPYTAGAVGSIAFRLPVAAVDGNVIRVFARWLNDDTPVDKLRTRLQAGEAAAWVAKEDPGAWSQALMELGATVCTPRKPLCAACPVHDHCGAAQAGTAALLPVRAKAGKHEVVPVHVAVYRQVKAVWLTKRPAGGLLAGLWGFPMPAKRPGVRSKEILRYKHVFTHRTWEARVFLVPGKPPRDSVGKWVAVADLAHEAIPTAFQAVVRYLAEPRLL
jgi:A/G-specific adenine glycosylase